MKNIFRELGYVLVMWALCGTCRGQAIITTAAGTGTTGFSGDGGPASSAKLGAGPGTGAILTVATDNNGNLLIVDGGNRRIRKVAADGTITTIAGGGGATTDGGPATGASLFPGSVSVDAAGNLYIAQGASIRKVNTSGVISTIAGGPFPGYSGDGGPALAATMFCTNAVADSAGNVYLADTINQRIRKVDTAGIITTVAGNGQQGYSGDGGPATSAKLALPQGVAVDTAGNIYFADNATHIRKVDTSGIITTVAGNGTAIAVGDGGPATSAGMTPTWVTVDNAGNLYIADTGGRRIRKVNTSGIISTLAGGALNTGLGNGDGGPATSGVLVTVSSVAVDAAGNVYIGDPGADLVRKVSSGAAASPITASPSTLSFSVNVGAAAPPSQMVVIISPGSSLTFTAAASTTSGAGWLSVSPTSGNANNTLTISVNPAGLAAGVYNGTITITPSGAGNTPATVPVKFTVNAATSQGIISTVAGNGFIPYSGEGGAATSAAVGVSAVAVDGSGNLYIADTISNKILKVTPGGTITTLAGNGATTYAGDGGPATKASFFSPSALAADNAGNVYIADSQNNRVRKVDSSGTITTVAGNGSLGLAGDGGPAKSASLWLPSGLALDSAGNLYIADTTNGRIRKVDTSGTIRTVAGGALLPGFSGDGGAATSAGLFLPGGVAVDGAGNLYIADIGNNRVRKVNAAGIISTVAGNGNRGFSGDGGSGTAAMLNFSGAHAGLGVDGAGNLYLPDIANNRVRKVDGSGVITTVAGNGIAGFSGDSGPATSAGLSSPNDVAVDSSGNLYIGDGKNNRVRKVTLPAASATPSIATNGIVNGASFQPGIVPNSWVTIQGSNLAAGTDTWNNFIVNGKLPTTLDGVTVSIGGKPAYLDYISPTQINLLAPDVPGGSAQVTVTTPAGTSSTFTVGVSQYGPAFFPWPGNQAVATRSDFSFAVANGSFPGVTTTAAKPGDVIILWGTGFGPTTPAAPVGVQLPADQTYSASTLPTVKINNVTATVYGAALAPGFAGLYQVAIQVPTSLADGSWPVIATVGGVSSPSGVVLAVQK
ncbi:MAG TPA: IPT/TIG domain-containing protein [Candidatus Sulfopaludibacter sp.]|jgi:uncharacterized protein (TIGR03437 family)|nr:IPT/TIG domain-containing protein [Candidatus Sulfopaludibacter sp.]